MLNQSTSYQSTLPQQAPTSKNKKLNLEELFALLHNSVHFPDEIQREMYKRDFDKQIEMGANIPRLFSYIESRMINAINRGESALLEQLEDTFAELSVKRNEYDNLLTMAENVAIENKAYQKAIKSGASPYELSQQQSNIAYFTTQINKRISELGPERVRDLSDGYRSFLIAHLKREELQTGVIGDKSLSELSEYQANKWLTEKAIELQKQQINSQQNRQIVSQTENRNKTQQQGIGMGR